ncbi:MAG: ABC transporter substrate-binding protein [Thermodesulfobacteriota bacterium]
MKKEKVTMFLLVFFLAVLSHGSLTGSFAVAAEKVTFGIPARVSPAYYLPMLAAQEKGFWEEQGLEVKWLPFKGAGRLFQAVATGHVKIGGNTALGLLIPLSRGVSVVVLAKIIDRFDWSLWVKSDSPLRRPADLKGKTLGITRLAGTSYAYAQLALKAKGLVGQVRLVATGGVRARHAALKSRAIDASLNSGTTMARFEVKGEVRRLMTVSDYLPKDWVEHVIFADKQFAKDSPKLVSRIAKVILKATSFIVANQNWAMEKIKSEANFSPKAAREVMMYMRFAKDGRISIQALQNVVNLAVEYGMVKPGSLPPVRELYAGHLLSD